MLLHYFVSGAAVPTGIGMVSKSSALIHPTDHFGLSGGLIFDSPSQSDCFLLVFACTRHTTATLSPVATLQYDRQAHTPRVQYTLTYTNKVVEPFG